eukprot:12972352-Alexandrium_andersonii.AAC.1
MHACTPIGAREIKRAFVALHGHELARKRALGPGAVALNGCLAGRSPCLGLGGLWRSLVGGCCVACKGQRRQEGIPDAPEGP